MTAPTTFQDLPDDMLHEIFGHVFDVVPAKSTKKPFLATRPPEGAHLALRCVCRRWRDVADWVRLSTTFADVNTSELADAGAARARHPAACKHLGLFNSKGGHSTSVSRAATSLINGSPDLRRALSHVALYTCCLPALVPAVTPVASCTALTKLAFFWRAHEKKERAVPSNMLAPLSALRMLGELLFSHGPHCETLPKHARLTPLPALPDAPRLTCLCLSMAGNFVPVGSDAALGRLRRLELLHWAPVQELVNAEDPFLLRAAVDAGAWQPSRLTGLKDLHVTFWPVRDSSAPPRLPRLPRTGSHSGSEWAPLAGQVTSLTVGIESSGYKRPSTGIVAGLGALTALRELYITSTVTPARAGLLKPTSMDRVCAPHLTFLSFDCVTTPVSVAQFPSLVNLHLEAVERRPPLNLLSLVARPTLETLHLGNRVLSLPGSINLAELFVGGSGWPVLQFLELRNIVLEWDATGLDGTPTAAEFAARARQLLPALAYVEIDEPSGRAALPDRSRVAFVVACRRHVVPALLGMRTGGKWVWKR